MQGDRPISPLILAELYETRDDSLGSLLASFGRNCKPILGLVERWKKDPSPWARRMKFDFLAKSGDGGGNRLIFKRLFKQAWHDKDHELMAAFLVRLDRAIRRSRATRYLRINRSYEPYVTLLLKPRGKKIDFSTATTHYLRRRAWRYFRRLGFKSPAEYCTVVSKALLIYNDDDVRAGENLLDNWGLMHACFGKSPALAFGRRHTNVKVASGLGELRASPMFERLWEEPKSSATLLTLLLDAACRPVRLWSIELLRRHHSAALSSIDASLLLRLIDHADEDVAAFAAELLADARVVSSLPVTTWLRLLATRNGTVAAAVVEAFRRHVAFNRFTTAQAVEVACHTPVPVARLGLDILRDRKITTDADREPLSGLADARCVAAAAEIAAFAIERFNLPRVYKLDQVIPFLDGRIEPMRTGAFAAVTETSPAGTDPAFWSALLESPYDDIRQTLVGRLKTRRTLPGASADSLKWLWEGVLLNVHRGGRAKLSAVVQISRQITDDPKTAAMLLPVLAVAIRSVRPPEARHGLAAVVSAVERIPALAADVARHLPELQLDPVGGAR
jgi:hypothetical protein